ncbi:MAG: hypothetical protein LBC56_03660 [Oscillospiraceae bacterium]|jgi:Na+-translocating ferredoxin:NAD+ oxidoreductase RnfA subunit|nr:hypothetical protein [Oscillospiraceae bacterium]
MVDIKAAFAIFFEYALLASFAENVVLTRGIDSSSSLRIVSDRRISWILYALLLTFMCAVSALPLYLVNYLIRDWSYRYIFIPVLYVIMISATYFAVSLLVQNLFTKYARAILKRLPFASFNCALFGGILVAGLRDYSLSQTLGYALGTGIGYVFATVMIVEGMRRLELCDIPKAFKGLPISLIYIGILSLALYGLTGVWLVY